MYAEIAAQSFLDLGGDTCQAYPSNGSFNPFIISSKEAQIMDGT